MNPQEVLINIVTIRQIASNLAWIIFLIAAIYGIIKKHFKFGSLLFILFFASIFIHEADILKFGEGKFDFKRITAPTKTDASISTEKQIHISDIYPTQEYPSAQGHNYQESLDLRTNSAVMRLKQAEQPFWIGVANSNTHNFANPILFLYFKDKVNIRIDKEQSSGWIESDPNTTYYLQTGVVLQPGTGLRFNPLFIKFPREGIYNVSYTISGSNEIPVKGEFQINVKQE